MTSGPRLVIELNQRLGLMFAHILKVAHARTTTHQLRRAFSVDQNFMDGFAGQVQTRDGERQKNFRKKGPHKKNKKQREAHGARQEQEKQSTN